MITTLICAVPLVAMALPVAYALVVHYAAYILGGR